MSSVGACKNALANPARYGTVNAQTRNSTIRARLPDQPKNNDGCEIFCMNGKAAEPRVRGLMLLVPEDFLFSGGQIFAEDIDVLLPETWLSEQWSAFQTLLQAEDWRLIDAHEHTFEKRGVHCSFAALEELETFAGVPISEIETRTESGTKYRLLSVKQYLAVYKASAKDGYRVNTRGKKDAEKIALLEKLM